MKTIIHNIQNVIKVIIFIFFIFLINLGRAQTNISGIYHIPNYTVDGGVYTKIEFQKNGNFKKETTSEFGIYKYGEGEYSFIGNKLILNYNKTEPIKLGYHDSKIWTNNKYSINIHFSFFDFDSVPLPNVNVIYKDSLSKYGYGGVTANEKGVTSLTLKKGKTNLQFKISNLGFKEYEFTIDKKYNYSISIFLQKNGVGLPLLNQIDTLNIDKIKIFYCQK